MPGTTLVELQGVGGPAGELRRGPCKPRAFFARGLLGAGLLVAGHHLKVPKAGGSGGCVIVYLGGAIG